MSVPEWMKPRLRRPSPADRRSPVADAQEPAADAVPAPAGRNVSEWDEAETAPPRAQLLGAASASLRKSHGQVHPPQGR